MKLPELAMAMAVLMGTLCGTNAPAAENPPKVCLKLQDIQRSEVLDDRTIVYHMRDGKVWRNTLRRACPMLKNSPYTVVAGTDLICSNQQFIHLALTGDDCPLGEFTSMPAER
jgi:hypothetical protein